ncbi:hypothetical protein E2562_017804 [Oryza meyeriana var. granulata]|uniref:Uncharacterized protein n=1 Tax=Oryza meyeriana var. granulata TaxID=110450 RepID=A0A6G1BLH6_9ORYZ|nr:hypothetical protein E2562_017804 [Oryza meyeriana var. granulata]
MVSWWLQKRALYGVQGQKVFDVGLSLFCWLIWKERNGRVFKGVSRTAAEVADAMAEEWWSWRAASLGARKEPT